MKNIGVIGGGQLARMLALAAYPLGLKVICLEPDVNCPAAQVTDVIPGDYMDQSSLQALVDKTAVITYEFENIPLAAFENITAAVIYPKTNALAIAQDRVYEKQLFEKLGIPTTRFAAVDSVESLQNAGRQVGFPAMLKTRRWGYDGKGQAVVQQAQDLPGAWQQLNQQPALLENKISFQREVSCLAVRAITGEIAFYPLVENQHEQGILRFSQVIMPEEASAQLARDYVERILVELDYVGVLAVEFFEQEGKLIANEIAPRVHNSGHWTIEGAETSQFENHLRAITGLPLGCTAAKGYAAMVNFIGSLPPLATILAIPGVHCHLYGKEPRPGRKLGHATLCLQSEDIFSSRIKQLKAL